MDIFRSGSLNVALYIFDSDTLLYLSQRAKSGPAVGAGIGSPEDFSCPERRA